MEGKLVKSPSVFVKKIQFVQDFADIDSFTFPVHIHFDAQVRLLGHTIVDIYHHDYQLEAAPPKSVEFDERLFIFWSPTKDANPKP